MGIPKNMNRRHRTPRRQIQQACKTAWMLSVVLWAVRFGFFCSDWRWRWGPISVVFLFPLVMHAAYKESREEEKKRPTGRSPHHTNMRTNIHIATHVQMHSDAKSVTSPRAGVRLSECVVCVCVRIKGRVNRCVLNSGRFPDIRIFASLPAQGWI